MRFSSRLPRTAFSLQDFSRSFADWFPVPPVLLPKAAGVDISDASIKWIVLSNGRRRERVVSEWGHETLREGAVISGAVRDVAALTEALRQMKRQLPTISAAHASLPEEAAFVFSMNVPAGSSREHILNAIEFELETRVPIPLQDAVYDFTKIHDDASSVSGSFDEEIGVTVFPRALAETYASAFREAGITLLSLEVEARSIARCVSADPVDESVELLVDFGGTRTGFAVTKKGIPIFTSTVDIGGDAITTTLMKTLSLTPDSVDEWKNEFGIDQVGDKNAALAREAIAGIVSSLADEVAKHYRYWDTRRDQNGSRVSPVSRIVLVGGSANLRGLSDYIAGHVQAQVERGNVWYNVCDFRSYIPPIDMHESFGYATAIGLALRSS